MAEVATEEQNQEQATSDSLTGFAPGQQETLKTDQKVPAAPVQEASPEILPGFAPPSRPTTVSRPVAALEESPLDKVLSAAGNVIKTMPGPGSALDALKSVHDWATRKEQELSAGAEKEPIPPLSTAAETVGLEALKGVTGLAQGEVPEAVSTFLNKPLTSGAVMMPGSLVTTALAKKASQSLKDAGHTDTAAALDFLIGAHEAGPDFITAMSTPKNLAMMVSLGRLKAMGALGATVDRLVSAGFSYNLITDAFNNVPEVKKAIYNHDWEQAGRLMANEVGNVLLGVSAAKGAVEGTKSYEAVAGKVENLWTKAGAKTEAEKGIAGGPVRPGETDVIPEKVQGVAPSSQLEKASENLYKAIKPSKKAVADDFKSILDAALPQLSVVANKYPDVSTPIEMADAIEKHRAGIEAQLTAKASSMRGLPDARMAGVEDLVQNRMKEAFTRAERKYTPEEQEKAEAAVMKMFGMETKMQRDEATGEMAPTVVRTAPTPDLYGAENIRKRFADDTRSAFGLPPGNVPSAEVFAKGIAADALREAIDDKFEEMGVEGVKEWRAQEAPLISVRDALYDAAKRSQDAGKWNVWKGIMSRKGWGSLPTIFGAIVGGVHGAAVGELVHLGADWWRDQQTNPNVLTQKFVDRMQKIGVLPAAALPKKAATVGQPKLEGEAEPKLTKVLNIPSELLPPGYTNQSVIHHEYGHILEGDRVGIPSLEIRSHLHPEVSSSGAGAEALMDWSQFRTDEKGNLYTKDITPIFIDKFLPLYLGGGVINSLVDGIPLSENLGLYGDIREMRTGLETMGFTPSQQDGIIEATSGEMLDRLTGDPALDIIKKYASSREEGLPDTHHASQERLQQFLNEVKEARRGTKYETKPAPAGVGEGSTEPSAEVVRQPQLRGEGKSEEADLRKSDREKVRKGAAAAGTAVAGLGVLAGGKKKEKEEPEQVPTLLEGFAPPIQAPEKASGDVLDILLEAAEENDIPPDLLRAQAKQESGFKQEATGKLTSSGRARGVMQLMPKTAQDLGVDREDTRQNIHGGARYMRQLHDQFGSWDKALGAYDWGSDKVQKAVDQYGDKWLDHAPEETKNYVHSILRQAIK